MQSVDNQLTCSQISEQLPALDSVINGGNAATTNKELTTEGAIKISQIAASVAASLFPEMGSAIVATQSLGNAITTINGAYTRTESQQAIYKKQALIALYNKKNCANVSAQRRVSRSPIAADIQVELNRLGYQVGAIDGIAGRKTIAAIKLFQASEGMTVNGVDSNTLLEKLKTASNTRSRAQNLSNCRTDNQEIILEDGRKQSGKITICQTATGGWVVVQ